MYSKREKSLVESDTPSTNPKIPSFSSSLLDQIYRSIDDGDAKCDDFKFRKQRTAATVASKGEAVENDEMRSLRRACLIERWMEKKVSEKVSADGRRPPQPPVVVPVSDLVNRSSSLPENDPLFFSSGSSSSDSSFGGFSSSETESFGAAAKYGTSCFAASRPKAVRTTVSSRSKKADKSLHEQHSRELYPFDDYHNHGNTHHSNRIEECLIKSKSRALKIYANLKKVKQPISPGGRLTSFINSLFTGSGHVKKSKNSNTDGCFAEANLGRKIQSAQSSSACSSASSFSRSCLSKTSPRSRDKLNNGVKRTVRFYPVSVIVDEDCRPCGQRSIHGQDSEEVGRSMRTTTADLKARLMEENWKLSSAARNVSKVLQNRIRDDLSPSRNVGDKARNDYNDRYDDDDEDDNDEEEEDDAASDSSSDLFELDRSAFFGKDRFCEELPVYETTHLDTNRAIASGLIRLPKMKD